MPITNKWSKWNLPIQTATLYQVQGQQKINGQILVMGRTPFYRTSIELEHHFSNIERTLTCSSIGDQTQTLYRPGHPNVKFQNNLMIKNTQFLSNFSKTLKD